MVFPMTTVQLFQIGYYGGNQNYLNDGNGKNIDSFIEVFATFERSRWD